MTSLKLTISRAKKYYNTDKESDRNNLIYIYETLNQEEQALADTEIRRFLPSWID